MFSTMLLLFCGVLLGAAQEGPPSHQVLLDPSLGRVLMERHFPTKAVQTMKGIRNPANILLHEGSLYVASFMTNQVLKVSSYDIFAGLEEERARLTTFAGGVYCQPDAPCAILDGPWGMVARDDRLFIGSFGSDQILVFNTTDGQYLTTFADSEVLDCPEGMAFGPDGLLYVAAFLTNEVVAFNTSAPGYPVVHRVSAPELKGPEDLLFHATTGQLLVSSHHTHAVVRFAWTTRTAADGDSEEAQAAAEAAAGAAAEPAAEAARLETELQEAVAATDYARAAQLQQQIASLRTTGLRSTSAGSADPGGSVLLPGEGGEDTASGGGGRWEVVGQLGGTEEELAGPVGLGVDQDHNLYVTSYPNHCVVKYTAADLEYAGVFASGGGLRGPSGMAFGNDGTLYVASYDSNQLIVFNVSSGYSYSAFAGNTPKPMSF